MKCSKRTSKRKRKYQQHNETDDDATGNNNEQSNDDNVNNEERRQEVPIREIQRLSTPTSTITNSQFSLSQQSTSVNKRKCDGIADDETTATSNRTRSTYRR
jgi:hypothetical protein